MTTGISVVAYELASRSGSDGGTPGASWASWCSIRDGVHRRRHGVRVRARGARPGVRRPGSADRGCAGVGRGPGRRRDRADQLPPACATTAGQNAAFPGIPTWVQPAEWAAAHEPDHTILEWVDYPRAPTSVRRPATTWSARASASLATPGHTPGHQSVAVDTDEGLVILAGQACYTAGECGRRPGRPRRPLERAGPARLRPLDRRLRGLQPTRVLFGHDRDPWVA